MLQRNRSMLVVAAGLCLFAASLTCSANDSHEPGQQAEPVAMLATSNHVIDEGMPRQAMVDISSSHYEVSPMTVRAKVVCHTKNLCAHQKADGTTVEAATVSFGGVFKPTFDPADPKKQVPGNAVTENAIFGEYSPNVNISMYITNPDAHRQFEPGQHYYVDFSPAPAA